jgi:exonuclease SbcC
MKVIKRFDLVDFQSHKETHLEFVEGLNVIIGPSDSGKSSVVRALNFLISYEWNEEY